MKDIFHINKSCSTPLHIQLSELIHLAIHGGLLPPGTRLPTVRSLAVELGINANTVARVYRDMQERGFLELQRGAGTFVARVPPEVPLAKDQLDKIHDQARRLTQLCQQAGLSLGEFIQLAESTWKETQKT